jgi:hypothetical protein
MSNYYVNKAVEEILEKEDSITENDGSIKVIAEIIANQIIKKLLKNEQFRITDSADDFQICEKSKAA